MTATTKIGAAKAVTHIHTWMAAARNEALLHRHVEIEETDLLLGLLAQGGDAAALMGRHGVTLARARRGVTELDDAELARAGLAGTASLRPARLPTAVQTLASGAGPDLAPAAQEIVFERKGRARTDRQALAVMLSDVDSPAARLLEHLGADLSALRAQLESDPGSPVPGAARVPVPAAYRDEGMTFALCCTYFVSVPVEAVRATLSDPERFAGLMFDASTIRTLSDNEVIAEVKGLARTGRVGYRLGLGQEGQVVWRMRALDGRYAGQVCHVREYDLQRAPGGTLVRCTVAGRSLGTLGRIISPVMRPFIRVGLRHHCLLVASLCADAAGDSGLDG